MSKSKVVYIVLALFLGGLGIHNFYAGHNNRGLAQLLVTILTGWLVLPLFGIGIWVIVDMCTINKDSDGVAFS